MKLDIVAKLFQRTVTMNERLVPASNLILTINANVDNEKLSDADFREFVRNSLTICEEVKQFDQSKRDSKTEKPTGLQDKYIVHILDDEEDIVQPVISKSYSNSQLVKVSKYLSYVLRHRPDEIGLNLDSSGWVETKDLIEKSVAHGRPLDLGLLQAAVKADDKQRYSFRDDFRLIRANQGHSVDIDLSLESSAPPDYLYHGTATRFMDSISEQGLLKKERHHVHLSECIETASSVGKRYGALQLLKINAKKMHDEGFPFWRTDNGVWLVDSVPPQYFSLMEEI